MKATLELGSQVPRVPRKRYVCLQVRDTKMIDHMGESKVHILSP